MRKISVAIAGRHATSISLEEEFYAELCGLASEQNIPVSRLITNIDSSRTVSNLSSALRLYVLVSLQNKLRRNTKGITSK